MLQLSALTAAAVITWACFLPTSWWIVAAVIGFVGFYTVMEILSYRYHDRALKKLGNEDV